LSELILATINGESRFIPRYVCGDAQSANNLPTRKQMQALGKLATLKEQTFVMPSTKREASGEIRRLLSVPLPRRDSGGELS